MTTESPRAPEAPEAPLDRPPEFAGSPLLGVLAGLATAAGLALLVRFAADLDLGVAKVLSLVFVFALPILMGLVTVIVGDRRGTWSVASAFLLPVLAGLLAIGVTVALGFEGAICVVMLLPLWVPLLGMGGWIGRESRQRAARRASADGRPASASKRLVCVALVLPFVAGPLEERLPTPDDLRVVASSVEIAASPDEVWAQIVRVPKIRPEELDARFVHWMGFPRPVEATLSFDGVGGIRHASFEGGVVFIETVDVWVPGRRLEFSIHADAATVPRATLDEHVTVGGPVFDVLRGAYEIEPLDAGGVRLRLSSRHRISTRFNAYAHLWTDYVMSSIQEEILDVVRARAERASRKPR